MSRERPANIAGDVTTSQYSRDGIIFQVEYAERAVSNSVNVIGLRGRDGAVLAVEKIILNAMYENDAAQRVYKIQDNIALAFSGFWPDGNFLVELARQESIKYRQQYERTIPLDVLGQRLGDYVHGFTLNSSVRPFGIHVVLASWDETNGAQLYDIDNTGAVRGYFGCASGRGAADAKLELTKLNLKRMNLKNLVQQAGRIIYKLHNEANEKPFVLELAVVSSKTDGLVQINPSSYQRMAINFAQGSQRRGRRSPNAGGGENEEFGLNFSDEEDKE